jgi:hypothetical protein
MVIKAFLCSYALVRPDVVLQLFLTEFDDFLSDHCGDRQGAEVLFRLASNHRVVATNTKIRHSMTLGLGVLVVQPCRCERS